MPELRIQPFAEEHIPEAATLLEERHDQHRKAEPGLPANVDSRAAAIRDGKLIGYLLGAHRAVESWGSNMWVEYAGHAVREPELVRDLYAAAAEGWVARGRNAHYALVPATDPQLVDAWFRLSFGAQHAAGIQETPESLGSPPPNVAVRTSSGEARRSPG